MRIIPDYESQHHCVTIDGIHTHTHAQIHIHTHTCLVSPIGYKYGEIQKEKQDFPPPPLSLPHGPYLAHKDHLGQ